MAESFYPFVENGNTTESEQSLVVRHPARIAVFDDLSAAPRVVVVEPQDVRSYLEELTKTVTSLAHEQGGTIPFMVIREIVENFIHAYFMEPTISILEGGNQIRFSDQGPGIPEKDRALQFGTTSATDEMKRYIRGVGSGLPYVQQWLEDKGGALTVEDNMNKGTVVTISLEQSTTAEAAPIGEQAGFPQVPPQQAAWMPQAQPQPYQPNPAAGYPQQHYPATQPFQHYQAAPYLQPQGWPQTPQAAPMPAMEVTDHGRTILGYLLTHTAVGPRDLVNTYGLSESTWSRELSNLERLGLVVKQGRKRQLTQAGRTYLGV